MKQAAWGEAKDRFVTLKATWHNLSHTIERCDAQLARLVANYNDKDGAPPCSAPSTAQGLIWPQTPFALEGAADVRGGGGAAASGAAASAAAQGDPPAAANASSRKNPALIVSPALKNKVPLLHVCTLLDSRCRNIKTADFSLRKGRYTYLDDPHGRVPFDDFTVDQLALCLGTFGNIRGPAGTFATMLTRGKITPCALFHVLAGANPQETRYLRHALAATPASLHLKGTNLAEQLDFEGLATILVPYPPLPQRLAFTRTLDLIQQELLNLPAETLALVALGDKLFNQTTSAGTRVLPLSHAATLRPGRFCEFRREGLGGDAGGAGAGAAADAVDAGGADGADSAGSAGSASGVPSVPVVAPRGMIAQTGDVLVDGPALVLGNLGPWLAVQYLGASSAPNADTVFVGAGDSDVPLAVLFFALRAAGAVCSAAETGAARAREGLKLEGLAELELALPHEGSAEFDAFVEQAEVLLELVAALQLRGEALRQLLWMLNYALLDDVLPQSLEWQGAREAGGADGGDGGDGETPGELPDALSGAAAGATDAADEADKADSLPGEEPPAEELLPADLPPELAGIPPEVIDLALGILEAALQLGVAEDALQISCPPPNQARWQDGAVDAADPRWVFGPPPPTRANYAWIQQTISQMSDKSCAVMLLCNDALHTEHPNEKPLREALAATGLVKAVITLPGRIFSDARPPSALVVLAKGMDVPVGTLFIDLQEKGQELQDEHSKALIDLSLTKTSAFNAIPGSDPHATQEYCGRTLPQQVVEKTLALYRDYLISTTTAANSTTAPKMPPHTKLVDPSTIEAHNSQLTPWTYLYPTPADPPPLSLQQALPTYQNLRQSAQHELNQYLFQ